MRRKVSLLIIMAMVLSSLSITSFAMPNVSVILDGKEIQFSDKYGYPFIDENNRTQVPLRAVMEAFGCTVTWDSVNSSAIITKEGKTVVVPIGKNYISVNGLITATDTTATIRNDRTYLPIRAVLEAFGANVIWDAVNNAVMITSPSSVMSFESIYIDKNGDLIIQLLDGSVKNLGTVKGTNGTNGIDGENGKNGVSVVDAFIDSSGQLMIKLSNEHMINAGTVSQTGRTPTFDDYDIGTRFYLTRPVGNFDTTIYVDSDPYIISFDAIYYELTAKYDVSDSGAWFHALFGGEETTFYLPYQVTLHISGKTNIALAGKQLGVYITNTKSTYYWDTTVQSDGTFSDEFVIGDGVNSINVWYTPQTLYFQRVVCQDLTL